MNKKRNLHYTCVNCGTRIKELYKMYSPSVLKLNTCYNCNEISDKYIEYDPVIIIIDLILLKKEAYRHFLYNTEFKNFWKLTILVQLMETYSEWMFDISKSKQFENINNSEEMFLKQYDVKFYLICIKIMIETLMYNIVLYILTSFTRRMLQKTKSIDFVTILKVYTISSFGKFFLLPALIWSDHTSERLNILFVFIYTTLCQFLVYSFALKTSMYWAIIINMISNLFKIMCGDILNSVLLYLFINY